MITNSAFELHASPTLPQHTMCKKSKTIFKVSYLNSPPNTIIYTLLKLNAASLFPVWEKLTTSAGEPQDEIGLCLRNRSVEWVP